MTTDLRSFFRRCSSETVALALAVLFTAPIIVCLMAHPSLKMLILTVCVFPAAVFVVRRLSAHGEVLYVGAYLALLYPLLLPGVLGTTTLRYYVFYYCITILLLAPVALFRRIYPLAKTLCMLGVFLVFSINLVFIAYALQTGARMDQLGMLAIYQTDIAEAAGYIQTFIGPIVAVGVGSTLAGVLLIVGRLRPPTIHAFSRRWQWVVVAGALALAWETRGSSNEYQLYSTISDYHDMLQDYRAVSARRQTDYRGINARRVRERAETHVVVIGESSTRNHMDIYGYFRPTTPKLREINDELVVFTDVISSHSHTMEVLEKALTLSDQDNDLDYSHPGAYSLLELFRAAGVTTYWLSNQNRFGIWDNIVTILAEGADHVTFMSDRLGEDYGASPDEILLPPLREALADDSGTKVIFLHLMGTHGPYHRRYPPEFTRFAGSLPAAGFGAWSNGRWITNWFRTRDIAKRVNAYDNALLYNDSVIYHVIELLREQQSSATLLYFSDHGESPLEGTGHDSALFSPSHVEIPFLFWFSDEFKAAHRNLISGLVGNRHKQAMVDILEHTLLDLVGIDTSYLDKTKSLFQLSFVERDRQTLNGTVDYAEFDDPLLNAKRNMQQIDTLRPTLHRRIWAHRANSLGKLSDVVGIFPGAEIDLVFNDATDRLEVRHPPVDGVGLDLEEVLRYLGMREVETRLWLDFKNVEEDNLRAILARMTELDQRYGLKDRVIVETTYEGAGFDQFIDHGLYTSYYLPTDDVLSAMEAGDPRRMEQLAGELADVVKRHRARAISFDIRLYDFVRGYLGEFAAVHELDYLTWDLTVSSSQKEFAREICERDLDERIKVILVPFTSRFNI